ncbi:MAG: 23S rRNA (pseudouridine(1915)-N(3))-methyltransferase RlmH [Pseudomonadota bacterium]|jgi:23S rRNA (pseudouridine1915-N3)-methyltransferase|nr:23S rRNA (pseudouridine(1915)-N(3))-methyltransferase RlmH [Pseudomonadota bacterium]
MRIRLIAVGTRMPAWVETAYADYAGRLPRELRLELMEIPVATRGKNPDIARLKQQEGERMLKLVSERDRVIALDERGQGWSSEELAQRLARWQQDGLDVDLLVGGPDGLADGCLQRAESRWSLSPLTLPHALVRVLLAEQLYRAWSLLANHPYHRA